MKAFLILALLSASSLELGMGQKIDANGKLSSATTASPKSKGSAQQGAKAAFEFHTEDDFCRPNPKLPFYQRDTDGAVCCRGKQLPVITLNPEISGECSIKTETKSDGTLDSLPLWCSYSCQLKKLGAINAQGKTVPDKFFKHLTEGLSEVSKTNIKTIMDKYLGCYKAMQNSENACYTPLSFHKCYQDALVFLCSVGMPKNNDFSGYTKVKASYDKLQPFCYYNNRKLMPGCCSGRPLPWTAAELMESIRNETKYQKCLTEMGDTCDATCVLRSVGVVNDDFDLDVDKFGKLILKHFPTVKPSAWMDYTGPVFLFYDEILIDMGEVESSPTERICRFHDRVMELHESKVDQYCMMTPEELKQLVPKKSR